MGFKYEDFWDGALATTTDTNNPPEIPDNGTLTVEVEMGIAADGNGEEPFGPRLPESFS